MTLPKVELVDEDDIYGDDDYLSDNSAQAFGDDDEGSFSDLDQSPTRGHKGRKPKIGTGKSTKSQKLGFARNVDGYTGVLPRCAPTLPGAQSLYDGTDDQSRVAVDLHEITDVLLRKIERSEFNVLKQQLGKMPKTVLRVGTMCSGTDGPVFFLEELVSQLRKRNIIDIQLDHMFSCEIVPFKQAFIYRNTEVKTLFRNIVDLGAEVDEAPTALGSISTIPTGIDMLVSGCSCTEFSSLNSKMQNEFNVALIEGRASRCEFDAWLYETYQTVVNPANEFGTSHQTFFSMMRYVNKHRPKVVVLENLCKAPWVQTGLVFEAAGYAWTWDSCDSKKYGLPQTRMRGYFVAVDARSDTLSPEKALSVAAEWQRIMSVLKDSDKMRTANAAEFLYSASDPLLLRSRMEVESGSNTRSTSGKDPDWSGSRFRNDNFRDLHGLGDGRPLTEWRPSGLRNIRPCLWKKYFGSQPPRMLDVVDIFYLKTARCDGFDDRFKYRVYDLSQNVERMNTGKLGIMPCITPSGSPYLTIQGRPILGIEALRLQGIPQYRLRLANETQDNLRDLAGNAMSVPVVGAAMLSVLVGLCKATGKPMGFDWSENLKCKTLASSNRKFEELTVIKHTAINPGLYTSSTLSLRTTESIGINELFVRARAYCICHGGAPYSRLKELWLCVDCDTTLCNGCKSNPFHRLIPYDSPDVTADKMMALDEAVSTLFKVLPHKLAFEVASAEELATKDIALTQLLKNPVYLKHIYPEAAALFAIYASTTGQIHARLDADGVSFFARPAKSAGHPNNILGPTSVPYIAFSEPVQSLEQLHVKDGKQKLQWRVRDNFHTRMVHIQPQDDNSNDLKVTFDSRDASELASASFLNGVYRKLLFCDAPRDILYRHESYPLFLFQDVGALTDSSEDRWVIGRTHSKTHTGMRTDVLAVLPQSFDPWLNPCESVHDAGCIVADLFASPTWTISLVKPSVVDSVTWELCRMSEARDRNDNDIGLNEGASHRNFLRMVLDYETTGHWGSPLVPSGGLHIPTALAPLTRSFGQSHLPPADYIAHLNDMPLTACNLCCPRRPETRFTVSLGGEIGRFITMSTTVNLERALREAPAPLRYSNCNDSLSPPSSTSSTSQRFGITVDRDSICHRALGILEIASRKYIPEWQQSTVYRGDGMRVRFNVGLSSGCLKPSLFHPLADAIPRQQQQMPPLPDSLDLSTLFTEGRQLFPSQRDVVRWAIWRESGQFTFDEQEMVDFTAQDLGLRAEAVASRTNKCRGGILALDVGQGKTIITLALIRAQAPEPLPKLTAPLLSYEDGFIKTEATLVVVPHAIVSQWVQAARDFLGWSHAGGRVLQATSKAQLKKIGPQIAGALLVVVSFHLITLGGSTMTSAAEKRVPFRALVANHRAVIARRKQVLETLPVIEPMMPVLSATTVANKRRKTSKTQPTNTDAEETDQEPCSTKRKTPVGMRVDGKDDAILEKFKFKRVVWDEVSYTQRRVETFVQNISAECKWLLTGTPPLSTLADVCRLSEAMNVHVARKECPVIPGFPFATRGPEEAKSQVEEVEEALGGRKTTEWALHRHMQACNFISTAFFKPIGVEKHRFNLQESICLVDQDDTCLVFYQRLQAEAAALAMVEDELPAHFRSVMKDIHANNLEVLFMKLASSSPATYDQSLVPRLAPERKCISRYPLETTVFGRVYGNLLAEILSNDMPALKSQFDQAMWLFERLRVAVNMYDAIDQVADMRNKIAQNRINDLSGNEIRLKGTLNSLNKLVRELKSRKPSAYFGGKLNHLLLGLALHPRFIIRSRNEPCGPPGLFGLDETGDVMPPSINSLAATYHWYDWYWLDPSSLKYLAEPDVRRLYFDVFVTLLMPSDLRQGKAYSAGKRIHHHSNLLHCIGFIKQPQLSSDTVTKSHGLKSQELPDQTEDVSHLWSFVCELNYAKLLEDFSLILTRVNSKLDVVDQSKPPPNKKTTSKPARGLPNRKAGAKGGMMKFPVCRMGSSKPAKSAAAALHIEFAQSVMEMSELLETTVAHLRGINLFHGAMFLSNESSDTTTVNWNSTNTDSLASCTDDCVIPHIDDADDFFPPGSHEHWQVTQELWGVDLVAFADPKGTYAFSPVSECSGGQSSSSRRCQADHGNNHLSKTQTTSNSQQPPSLDDLYISALCGHVLCRECYSGALCCINPSCPIVTCRAPITDCTMPASRARLRNMAVDVYRNGNADTNFLYRYGAKIDAITRLITSLPAESKVLVFYQFPEHRAALEEVMSTYHNKSVTLVMPPAPPEAENTKGKGAAKGRRKGKNGDEDINGHKAIQTAQSRLESVKGKAVLFLDMTSCESAGLNLHSACHVVFVSPLLERDVFKWDMLMRQAIGRSARYPQCQTVHIYHFATRGTLEVDVLEARLKMHILADEAKPEPFYGGAGDIIWSPAGNRDRAIGYSTVENGSAATVRYYKPARCCLGASNLSRLLGDPTQSCDIMSQSRPNDNLKGIENYDTVTGRVFADMGFSVTRR